MEYSEIKHENRRFINRRVDLKFLRHKPGSQPQHFDELPTEKVPSNLWHMSLLSQPILHLNLKILNDTM